MIDNNNYENLFMNEGNFSQPPFDKNILSSVHISFLFGSGVNGNAFPQLSGFTRTIAKMEELNAGDELGFEEKIDTLNAVEREIVKTTFIEEFRENEGQIKWDSSSIVNLELMLKKTAILVGTTQNRTKSMKQINIYSLNYDNIVEEVLKKQGLFYNSISSKNINNNARLANVIGYDYNTGKCIPSFLVSKLHGDISEPIIPGKEKYRDILNENYFEIAFNMKEHLSKANSVLIVIGYSGNDKHINKILKDCINNGLIIYWYKYSQKEIVIDSEKNQLFVREQEDYNNPQDSTKNYYEDLCKIWDEKLEG